MTPTLLNNRYRILRTLGAGGFGNTFLAEDTYMPSGRKCVIKQLKPVTHDPQVYKLVQERFQREAAVLEELGEGNNQIPRLYAYFSETEQFYLVQEYIEGDTLTQKVERGGSRSESDVTRILISLLPVLDYVHSRRMIHRDIKPDNVIMRQRDTLPVLIDFGAVKEAMTTVVNMPSHPPQSMVIGTPGFMPAEQAGGRPTYASDLYSLGLTAVFLLTGKIPQDLPSDNRTGEILWRQYAPNVNSNLAMVLDRAIRFNASDRFSTAKEMLNALQSGDDISHMDTVAVAPGGLPQSPNRSLPRQTVPAGTTPAIQGNKRNPLLIAALVAAGFLVAGVGIGLSLSRSPAPSTPVASNSKSTSEQEASGQGTSSANSSRSQPATSEPNVLPPASPSQRETQASSQKPPLSSPAQPIPPPPLQRGNNQNSNQIARIPGFPPGTQQSYIQQELGKPTKATRGLWNTRALLYENYIPGQVSLGYLYDPGSGRVRQTEVSFAESVDLQTISSTLNLMLNHNASADIKQGLERVYQTQSKRYQFVSGRNNSLKGVIERNEPGRIYIGVWEADLH